MNLRVVTPLEVIVDQDIDALRAEDSTGSFGILPGHADFITSLTVSVIRWTAGKHTTYCAVRRGVLSVEAGNRITVATREAITGDDLATLDRTVLSRFQEEYEQERIEHVESVNLQLLAIRKMIGRLSSRRSEHVL